MEDIFVSQNEQHHHPEFACGVAALMMLLKAKKLNPLPDFVSLSDSLRLTVSPVLKGLPESAPAIGLDPEDLFTYCVKNNLPFRMLFLEDEWENGLKQAPIMVLMTGDEDKFGIESHWIVLIELDQNHFTYLDPWYKKAEKHTFNISIEDFKAHFTGIALQLL